MKGRGILNFFPFKGVIERGMGHKAVASIHVNMSIHEKKYYKLPLATGNVILISNPPSVD